MEFTLSLDQFETSTVRISTDFLSYLGDVGGFLGAISILTGTIGTFFSSSMFVQNVAQNFFLRALSKQELKKKKAIKMGKIDDLEKLKGMFTTINISFFWLFIDPFLNFLVPFSCCKSLPCRKRTRILKKSFDKFQSQLDLNKLLNFMRDISSMLAKFKNKEQRLLLRFAKNRTIKLSESDDSGSGEENRH